MRTLVSAVVATVLAVACVATASPQGLARIDVTLGKSQVLDLKEPFTRVSVTHPGIADVFVITPTQILINGKTVGVTSLVVFYPGRTLFFDLTVQGDLDLLRDRLRAIAPGADIQAHPAQDAVVLTGRVATQSLIAGAQEVASVFAAKGRVVNLLTLAEPRAPQVMLQVQVAEATREALRELGFNILALGETVAAGIFPGVPFVPTLGSALTSPNFPLNGNNFFLASGSRDYAGVVHALATRNLLRVLAKPNLVTESGKEAKFLSGGEFPVPVAQVNGVITIEFKEFGVGLLFTPLVIDGETINLKIRPEVSSLDFSQGLITAGFRIPVIRKNEAATNINVRDGESFAIAGMINNEVRQVVDKIPVFGDIPILGALFRSTRFRNSETELLFLVTVKLVKSAPPGTPGTPDPTDLMRLRPEETKDFTLVPGRPGFGDVVDKPLGSGSLPAEK